MDSPRAAPRPPDSRVTGGIVRCDNRALSVVGRCARLHLNFRYRSGRTVLAEAYAEPPFRIGRWFAEGERLHMIIASTAPGVFGGDQLRQIVHIGAGARVRLTSQSALQIHPSLTNAAAALSSSYFVEDGGHLSCDWHPLIPFAEARIEQKIDVNIAGDGCVYWSDAWMSGREARGERWQFACLGHEIAVARDGSLEYLERYRIEPNKMAVSRPWAAADASYLGTTLVTGGSIGPRVAERIHGELGRFAGLTVAADQLAAQVLLIRLLSRSGSVFHEARRWISDTSTRLLTPTAEGCGNS